MPVSSVVTCLYCQQSDYCSPRYALASITTLFRFNFRIPCLVLQLRFANGRFDHNTILQKVTTLSNSTCFKQSLQPLRVLSQTVLTIFSADDFEFSSFCNICRPIYGSHSTTGSGSKNRNTKIRYSVPPIEHN